MARLEVRLVGVRFANPVVLASGPAGFGFELAAALDLGSVGALTTKTVTWEPRDGNPQPRIVDAPAGTINSIGLENPGVAAFLCDVLPRLRALPTARIVSLAGRSPEEAARVAARLDEEAGIDAFELNLSCPNVQGETVADRPDQVSAYVRAVRRATTRPLLAKLQAADGLTQLCARALEAGADGLTLINAIRAMRIDTETRRPFLARECGGLCGPAIFPIALGKVFEVRRAFPDAFIVGTGGVHSVRGVVEMLCAGADLVGVGHVVMADPAGALRLAVELDEWLDGHGVADVAELVGSAHRGVGHVH